MRICVCECAHMRAHLLANLCSGDQHWGGGLSTPCYFLLTRVLTRVRLCVTLPGSSVYGILQARILEWVALHQTGVSYISCISMWVLYH